MVLKFQHVRHFHFNQKQTPIRSIQIPSKTKNFSSNFEIFFVFSRFISSSQPHSALHSPFYRSTPIDPMQEWIQPATASTQMLTSRSQSADPSTTGLFSTYSSQTVQQPTPSFSFDGNFNNNQFRSASSLGINLFEHQKQQNVQATMSKDSIERHNDEPTSTTNEALSRYVKLLLERSPAEETSSHCKSFDFLHRFVSIFSFFSSSVGENESIVTRYSIIH